MASSVVDLILSHRDASITIVVTCVTVVALAFVYIYSNGKTSSCSPRKHDKLNNKLMNQRKTIDKLTNEGSEHRKIIKAREQTIRSLKRDQKKEKEKVKKFNGVRKEDKDKIWSQQKKIREYEEAFCSMIKETQSLRDKNRNLSNKYNRQKRRIERIEGKIKERSCQLNHINQKFWMMSKKKNEEIKSLRQQLHHECTKHQEDIESAKKDQEKKNKLIKLLRQQYHHECTKHQEDIESAKKDQEKRNELIKSLRQQYHHECTKHQEDIESAKKDQEKRNELIKSLRQQYHHECTKHQEDIESAKKDQEKRNELIKSLRQQYHHKCTEHQEDIESAKKAQEKRNELIKSLREQVKKDNERIKELEEILNSRKVICETCGVSDVSFDNAVHEELRATDSQGGKFDAAGSEVEIFPSQVDLETGNQPSSSATPQNVNIKKDSSTQYRDPLVISSENEISLQVVGTVVSTNVIEKGVKTDIVLPEILVDKGDVLRSAEGLSEATLDRIQNTLTELSPQFDDISDDKYQKILLSNCDTEYDILAVVAGLYNRYISQN